MIDELRTFLAVTETGSFSRVARDQSVAVSSVTRKIDALEAALETRLLLRNTRGVTLTDAGLQYLTSARNIVAEFDEAKTGLAERQVDPSGVLTVTAPAAFGRRHVMPAAVSFLRRYPQIALDLHFDDNWVDLAAHRVDVAIRIGTLPDSDLVAVPIAPLRRVVCASSEYVARAGRPAKPEDLLQHNCLTIAQASAPRDMWCFAGVRRGNPIPVSGTLRTNDTESLMQAALDGVGIVHLANWLVGDLVSSGRLISLFPDLSAAASPSSPQISAVRMPGRSHAAKSQLFISHLKREFGEPVYWDRTL